MFKRVMIGIVASGAVAMLWTVAHAGCAPCCPPTRFCADYIRGSTRSLLTIGSEYGCGSGSYPSCSVTVTIFGTKGGGGKCSKQLDPTCDIPGDATCCRNGETTVAVNDDDDDDDDGAASACIQKRYDHPKKLSDWTSDFQCNETGECQALVVLDITPVEGVCPSSHPNWVTWTPRAGNFVAELEARGKNPIIMEACTAPGNCPAFSCRQKTFAF